MRWQLKLWDSKRERERKLTGPNTLLAVRRTKEGLSNSREELASGGLAHPRRGRRHGGGERGKLGPSDGIPTTLQTGLQFLTKGFLRFWMVDIRQEVCG